MKAATSNSPRTALRVLVLTLSCCAATAAAQPLPAPDASRGRLLYETHCIGCHTTQPHWRDNRLATDWPSLKGWVGRWQGTVGLGWTDADIGEVARFLNDAYYRFPQTGGVVGLAPHPARETAPE